tara:strand:+ start:2144 stop:3307 length:1164 start_codon:yes stop_codon:yes gene_type:complete
MSTNADNACMELKKTYNANILKKYSPEIQETFKIICNLCKDSNRRGLNKNLVKLINNLQYPPKPSKYLTKFITGPGEITRLKHPTLPQDIYLFGENDHSNKYGCLQNDIKIEKYLQQLFSTTTKFIDIYIEFQIELNQFSRKDCDVIGEENTLCDIYKFFRKCITSDSTTCNYPIRLHPTDIRNTRKDTRTKTYQMLIDLWEIKGSPLNLKIFIKKYKTIIYNIRIINIKSQQYIIDSIFENKTISKEIKRSTLSLHQFYKALKCPKIWDNIKKDSYIMIKICRWLDYKSHSLTERDISHFSYYLREIFILHMDIYTLARMFKKFNITYDHHPPKPLNIIYYAGTAHTKNMLFMLQELGFNITENSIPVTSTLSCTNIQSLKQPLFS